MLDKPNILVTHDRVEATTLATANAVLRDREFQQIGSSQEINDHPNYQFTAGLLSTPKTIF